jgi:hypothetical protein
MDQKRLTRIKLYEGILLAVMVLVLSLEIYNSIITKNTTRQIISSILLLGCTIFILEIRKLKSILKIKLGLIKAYGERCGFNPIMMINLYIGIIFLILAFLNLNNINDLILKLTLGLCWIVVGVGNRRFYYLQLTDSNVVKMNLDFLKIKDIELITYTSQKVVLKTAKRTMNISFLKLKTDEQQQIVNDFDEIRLKGNLS